MPQYIDPNVFAAGASQQHILPPSSYTDAIGVTVNKVASAASASASASAASVLAENMPTEGLAAVVNDMASSEIVKDLGKVTEQLISSSEHIHTYTQKVMTLLVGRFDFMDQLWCGYAHGLEQTTGERPELRLAMVLAFVLSMVLWLWLTYRWVVRPYSSVLVSADAAAVETRKKKDM